MRLISRIIAVARNMLDKPLVGYSQVRVAGYFYNVKAWWASRNRLLTLPFLLWSLLKDPFIVAHLIFLAIAPILGLVLIAVRLTRETLGLLFLFVFIFLPFELFRLVRTRNSVRPGSGVALVTISNIDVDIRIEKYRKTLLGAGFTVLILGTSETPFREEKVAPGFQQIKVPIERHKLSMYWRSEQFFELLRSNCGIYHANDLTSLVVCYYASLITNAALVFDAHEVWTENVEFDTRRGKYVGYPNWKKTLLTAVEKFYSRRADLFVTVNSEIAERYEKLYELGHEVTVVRNVPTKEIFESQTPSKTSYLTVPEGTFLVGYIGGLGPSRNIEGVIRALPFCSADVHFQIMGPNADMWRPEYQKLANDLGVGSRVHVTAGVPMHEVFSHMARLSAGILMLENLCLNFYLFLPNKIFEYMAAGVPVLTSNFPVVRKIVEQNNLGFTFDPSAPKDVAAAIERLRVKSPAERQQMGNRAKALALSEFYWEKEVTELLRIYKGLTAGSA